MKAWEALKEIQAVNSKCVAGHIQRDFLSEVDSVAKAGRFRPTLWHYWTGTIDTYVAQTQQGNT